MIVLEWMRWLQLEFLKSLLKKLITSGFKKNLKDVPPIGSHNLKCRVVLTQIWVKYGQTQMLGKKRN